ncbi:ribonuclease P protein component 1 [Methanocella paludicola SANAE]|uniref:Ribonuclease P protein component 1 n=1 Tax=Methanocella paludicola (strain DSM 17711 / JCM 13418 / NBRC 101707 / SANAE) TaxID=304371 RepID=D1Z0S9_METPS|nr:ribonuclease P protein subunit [Methanocella paludicola]BAI62301.1 ribonuclease P protein component 1 [Methanocella paludicola SANAE]
MDLAPENLIYHELIGLPVEVESAGYRLKGVVVDETRNMLVIGVNGADKKVPKNACAFIFTLPDGRRVKVLGTLLQSQPENRIPKRKKRGK